MPRRPLEEPKNRAAQIVSDFWPNLETSADWHAEGGGGSGGSHVVAVEVSCRIFNCVKSAILWLYIDADT